MTKQKKVAANSTKKQKTAASASKKQFPIVGIGASAGGLEAFEHFFKAMPPNSNMAFVLIQHQDPTYKSILGDLIQRYTPMPVMNIKEGMLIQVNHVYIVPPHHNVALFHGTFQFMNLPHTPPINLPIDFFFRSLAEDQNEKAICIIMSGNGSDGSLGLKAIKGAEGTAIVQAPDTAKYDGMLRSAINTDLVDYILPPDKMPAQLLAYLKHPLVKQSKQEETEDVELDSLSQKDLFQKIFILLRSQTKHDFSYYKFNTIKRRMERRLSINQLNDLNAYIRYLQYNPLEVDTLFKELLIGVTNFFRNPDAFSALQNKVIPALFKNRSLNQALRIWVPGCSTGEEAYSIAILLQEHMNKLGQEYPIQIFATDINHESIEKARLGRYPEGIAIDVSTERLNRFFIKKDNHYLITKQIRDMLVFAVQNIIKDPPFSKIDLISCRNMLIYFNAMLQKEIFPLFHYSLVEGGFLFLGNSETLNEFSDVFEVIDRKWKLFKRTGKTLKTQNVISISTSRPNNQLANKLDTAENIVKLESTLNYKDIAQKILIKDYLPVGVIINHKGDILHSYGKTGKYLELPSGNASLNILAMARSGLKTVLAPTIRKATNQKISIKHTGIQVQTNGNIQIINLVVKPITAPSLKQKNLMLIIFEDVKSLAETDLKQKNGLDLSDASIQQITMLEQELVSTKEYLQTTIEELETANEELKSTNEELQSSNEELQSTNEELETSKEELQSVNEELITINNEHQNKIDALSQSKNDLNNLLSSTHIATIFLDLDLNIKRFTPAATQIINLIDSDINRPISHLVSKLAYTHLIEDATQVLKTLITKEIEVRSTEQQHYLMRLIPYRTLDNVIDGIVITFINITEQKQILKAYQESETKLQAIINNIPDYVLIINRTGDILYSNHPLPPFSKSEMIGSSIYKHIAPEYHNNARTCFKQVFNTNQADSYKSMGNGPDNTPIWYETRVVPMKSDEAVNTLILISIPIKS